MSITVLVQLTHYDLAQDYRRPLLRSAAREEGLAIHVRSGSERSFTVLSGSGTVETRRWSTLAELKTLVSQTMAPTGAPIVLTGVGGAWAPAVMAAARLFPRRCRFYDVQDDLRYGAQGIRFAKYLLRDRAWKGLCPTRVVLEQGMLKSYSHSYHLDNASDVRPGRNRGDSQRIVYIGSIDQRVDIGLVKRVLAHRPIDIWGGFHPSAASAREELTTLADASGRLRLMGPYDNDRLSEILAEYRVGMIPYVADSALTQHINPDKIYHYLNAGLRVLSAAFPQARRMSKWLSLMGPEMDLAGQIEDASTGFPDATWIAEDYSWPRRWRDLKEIARLSMRR